jgi:predicted Fe-Mo cluster-binding NifX family protein
MKIAISTDGQYVSPHFGRCPEFTILEIEDGKLINKETISNPGHHPGYLPQYLSEQGVSCIVAGGMGMRARELFQQANIDAILGVEGEVDQVVDKIMDGSLEGGESICKPGSGKGYGLDKTECDHE